MVLGAGAGAAAGVGFSILSFLGIDLNNFKLAVKALGNKLLVPLIFYPSHVDFTLLVQAFKSIELKLKKGFFFQNVILCLRVLVKCIFAKMNLTQFKH